MRLISRFFALTVLAAVAACSTGSDGTNNPPGSSVASVGVSLSNSAIDVGGSSAAIATVKDASGATLNRTVAWTSSQNSVATIASSGTITAVGAGTTMITATVEGKTGSAQLTVSGAVTQVAVTGATRMKVGDTYPFTAEARMANNTVVIRPITWSIVEQGAATISQSGVVTPLRTGPITVRATVETVAGSRVSSGYDWEFDTDGIVTLIALPADIAITNQFNQSEYPIIAIGCTEGVFILLVGTNAVVTHDGTVSYSFDNAAVITTLWDELPPDYTVLVHPGPTNLAVKNFVATMGAATRWGFGFTEYLSTAKSTLFRVRGLNAAVAPVLAACPSDALMGAREGESQAVARMKEFLGRHTR